ncbi:Hemerythrin HHE cation binding domain-containing protein [Friedmanniella luteola]|uniref:Hemerythrin HHE cation binding domain-containing protein n=1 Tax=Friedmanniella luteola TaxID=546871 RepID=A0A1H1ZZ55_9ACTN|nr:hemerythrin domain-containing protein [Friedmanniella luteola]SDT38994.1 Hemerythrin HHE cation binding domain-containing protein [Friedmanniella luteola]
MSAPADPAETLGRRLVAVHAELRETLRGLRASSRPGADGSLAAHCLTFCATVDRHHQGENGQLFADVVAQEPGLAAAVDQLRHDHGLIGFLLRDVATAVRALPATPDAQELQRFRRTLDGLAAVLEAHFTSEERAVLAAVGDRPAPTPPPPWDVRAVRQDDQHG